MHRRPHIPLILLYLISAVCSLARAEATNSADQSAIIAKVAPAKESICLSEQRLLDELEQQRASVERVHEQILQLRQGTLDDSVSPADLLSPDGGPDADVAPLPPAINCDAIRAEWDSTLTNLQWLRSDIARLRAAIWDPLPPTLREELLALWASRDRLQGAYDAMSSAASIAEVPVTEPALTYAGRVRDALTASRTMLIRLLATRADGIRPERAKALFDLWRYVVESELAEKAPNRAQIAALPDPVRERYRRFTAVSRNEVLQLRTVLNETRSYAWSLKSGVYRSAAFELAGSKPDLLRLELRSMFLRFERIVSEFGNDYQVDTSTESTVSRLTRSALKTGAGLALAFLLFRLAQLSRVWSVGLHARWSERLRVRRNAFQLIRLSAGVPSLLPWVIGWFGLDALASLYYHNTMVLLVPLVPFARLFILYGVLTLVGQWLLSRVVQQAGSFLSVEQTAEVDRRARAAAGLVMLPWLLADLVHLAIGPSLLEETVDALREGVVYLALGYLLKLRAHDVILALQSMLPPRIDPWVERMLHRSAFVFVAPITIALLIPFFGLNVAHRLLLDFDWYRMLYARGFRLQVSVNEGDTAETVSEQLLIERYRNWFDITPRDDLPIVSNGLDEAILSRMAPWLNDHGEENTLLLTGERGIGKTSSMVKVRRRLEKEHPDVALKLVWVEDKLTEPADVLSLIGEHLGLDMSGGPAALVRSDAELAPTVLILEDAHNLFLRKVDGLRGWDLLMSLTNARLQNVFWLIVMNNQSYAYLDNVFRDRYQLRNVLRARGWTQNEIRSLILSRHRQSAEQLRYDEVLLASRGPEAGNVRNAEQRYFSLLWDACRGNPMLALCLWMSSVHAQGRTIVVGLPVQPKLAALESIAGEFLFVYASMVIHENMSSDEIAATTALSSSVVRAALKTGTDAGFITRSQTRRYRIVPIWYPVVRNLLTRKNMLHE